MAPTIAVVVNKDNGRLSPSETFIQAHIEGLPATVIPLIGNPGYRQTGPPWDEEVPSRALPLRMARALGVRSGMISPAEVDRRAMADFLREHEVDGVLAEYGPTAVSIMDACGDAGVPLVPHFHGFDAYSHYVLERQRQKYRRLFDQVPCVVGVSSHMRDQLVSLGADPQKTCYNACGADLPAGLEAHPGEAPPRFVMIGRLTPKKAPLTSIRAFAAVAREHPEATLEIVGDGPLEDECKALVEELGLEDRITLRGAQPHDEVWKALAGARCFVQHSVRAEDGDHEGTPVSVLEAMGVGLPVVSTRHGGIRDVVVERTTGWLVDEHDQEGMEEGMRFFAAGPRAAAETGRRARAAVLENWTRERSVERLWEILKGAFQL